MNTHTCTLTGTLRIKRDPNQNWVFAYWRDFTLAGGNSAATEDALVARYRERNPQVEITPVVGSPGHYTLKHVITMTDAEALARVLDMADNYIGEYGSSNAGAFAFEIITALKDRLP